MKCQNNQIIAKNFLQKYRKKLAFVALVCYYN